MKYYIKKYKGSVFLVLIFNLLINFLSMSRLIFVYFFTDTLINNKNNDFQFILWISLIFVAFILMSFLEYFNQFFTFKFGYKLWKELSLQYCDKFTKMSYKEYNNNNIGKYVSLLFNETNQITSSVFTSSISLIAQIISLFVSLVILFIFNWILGIIIIPILFFFIFLPIFFNKKIEIAKQNYFGQLEKFNSVATNMMDGYSILYFANSTKSLKFIMNKQNELVANKSNKLNIINFFYTLIKDSSFDLFNLFILVITSLLIFGLINNNINKSLFIFEPSISIVIFNTFFLPTLYSSSGIILDQYVSIKSSMFLLDKLKDKNTNKNMNAINFAETFEKIELQNVGYKYQEKEILKNINFVFEKNKKYVIMGESGTGKSTLLKILLGIHQDYVGFAKINNIEIKKISPNSLYSVMNYLDNNNFLFDDNLRNNITLYDPKISDELINKNLKILNLNEFINNKEILSENDRDISVGQKQRLDLARKLLVKKPILIIDEGLSNLDEDNFVKIQDYLLQQKDLTLIFVTHHLKESMKNKYDNIYFL